MEFYQAIKNRRSIRNFIDKPIEEEKLWRILQAACSAPSWRNNQCWRIIVVRDEAKRRMIKDILDHPLPDGYCYAPIILVVCAEPSDSCTKEGKEYYLADCAIAMEHMLLAATEEGLGSCFVNSFTEHAMHNILGIPKDVRVVAISPLGYAAEQPGEQVRRPLSQTVYYDTWIR